MNVLEPSDDDKDDNDDHDVEMGLGNIMKCSSKSYWQVFKKLNAPFCHGSSSINSIYDMDNVFNFCSSCEKFSKLFQF